MKYLVTTFLALLAVLTGLAESSAALFLPNQSSSPEPPAPTLEWVDGVAWGNNGSLDSRGVDCSALITYVSVVGGHKITWYVGPNMWSGAALLEYAEMGGTRLDYWGNAISTRTIILKANTNFIRYTCKTDYLTTTYVYDETDGRYIIRDGQLVE